VFTVCVLQVELRARRGNSRTRFGAAWRAGRDIPHTLYDHLAASADGRQPCARGRAASLCTSCSAATATQRLCACATQLQPLSLQRHGGGRRVRVQALSLLTRPDFDAAAARSCCRREHNASGHE
jgi:hypothetical protein